MENTPLGSRMFFHMNFLSGVLTHVASSHANLLEEKKVFTQEKSSTPTGLVWDTNMAAVSLFWCTNLAAVT